MKRMRGPACFGAALTLAALLAAGAPAARADGPVTIRHGWVSMTNMLSPMIFEERQVLQHYGKTYTVEPMHFTGTAPEVTAIATGDIDIITLGFSTFATAIENAHMDDLRIIADGFQDGANGYLSTPYLVRNDSGIKTISDLKDKVLASNAFGGSLDVAMRAMLRQSHLEARKDYTLIEAPFPAMPAMLLQGKIDLFGGSPPFIYESQMEQQAHTLFTMKQAVGPSQMIVLAARTPFLTKNRAAVIDFFEDMLRGIHWALDPANRTQAVALVAKASKLPPEQLASYIYTKRDYYHDPMALPNLPALQHDMETQRRFGFLKSDLDVKKYVDLSYVEAAAKRMK